MINIRDWMSVFEQQVKELFGERIVCIGLQGSYGRGEATEASDLDVVVILNQFSFDDLIAYRRMTKGLKHGDLLCGFISGVKELQGWEPSELFSFYYDTYPYVGNLDFLKPLIREADVHRAIVIGACNVFHGCLYNYLKEQSQTCIQELKKAVFFTLRAKYYEETGKYIASRRELMNVLSDQERDLLCSKESGMMENALVTQEFEKLFTWAQSILHTYTRKQPEVVYRELHGKDKEKGLSLAWKVFLQFEAPDYSKEGIDAFYTSIHDPDYIAMLQMYGAYSKDRLVGVMATRSEGAHVALFFVEQAFQRQGIGTGLFACVCENSSASKITVHSSPYAVPVYHHLGFQDTSSEQVTDGLRYTPMVYERK